MLAKNRFVQAFVFSVGVYVLLRLLASSLVMLSAAIIVLDVHAYYVAAVAGAIHIVVAGVIRELKK